MVGLGAVVAVVALSGDDEAAAEELTVEPVSTAGENPFMPTVGTDQSGVTPPDGSGGTFSGDTVGLYGGTLNFAQCDPQKMVTFLQQNPDLGRAWAAVQRIRFEDIPTYVAELTPVILRSDTYVTNHGFANGSATVIPAVLQAGTAVMVDKYGTPRVKCYCGNPLTPSKTYSKPKYSGPRWPGFDPGRITIVQQTTVVIQIFTLVDPTTGEPFTRPAGSTGGSDEPSGPTTPSTSPPQTQAPQTQPPQTQAGPSAEEEAIAKLDAAAQACYPFPLPIEEYTATHPSTFPGSDPDHFVLQVIGDRPGGGTHEFQWSVDRSTLQFIPLNSLAQVASDHCPQLN
ncbi:MAG TPA: DUF6777 domain-containing protein [Acidimicrobiia bacterium]|nr:DUF6777 domain-containing protein [Acidimicrobiia bacterium]